MKILRQITSQPFIAMVALAALIHSTWSVSVMFNGIEPGVTDFASVLHWLWWVLPGVLFAVALDIGQLSSANSLRQGTKSRWALASKVATFATMAAFSYALQLLYLLHHVPLLSFGAGLSVASQNAAQNVWEVCIWLIPGMLPVSIIMFTATDTIAIDHIPPQTPVSFTALALVGQDAVQQITIEKPVERTDVECKVPGCEWAGTYETGRGAINAYNAHMRKHDLDRASILDDALERVEDLEEQTAVQPPVQQPMFSSNGRH